jgi:hypothetical protein
MFTEVVLLKDDFRIQDIQTKKHGKSRRRNRTTTTRRHFQK